MKASSGDETCEEVIVPCDDFASRSKRIAGVGQSQEIGRDVLDGGEIGGSVVGSDAAFVITEHHIQNPVQAVFE